MNWVWNTLSVLWLTTLLIRGQPLIPTQVPDLIHFFSMSSVQNLSWSSDSNRFVFGDSAFATEGTPWYQFDTRTMIVTERDVWPLRINQQLTRVISQNISPEIGRGEDFAYRSPNWRFLISEGRDEIPVEGIPYPASSTVIADFYMNRVLDIPLLHPAWDRRPSSFQVTWSDDSAAFVLATTPRGGIDLGYFTYVTGYAIRYSDAIPQVSARDFSVIHYENELYQIRRLYDISFDGSMVLVQTMWTPSTSQPSLFVWHVNNNTYQKIEGIDPGSSTDAVFDDESTGFYIINDFGLIHYDLQSGETEIIRDDINTIWVDRAIFSPNGASLILFDELPTTYANDMYYIATGF